MNQMDTFKTQFGKKITVRQVYDCSSVTNDTFSIERSPNGLVSTKFMRMSFF